MGNITRNFANNLTTSGLLKPTAFNNDSFDNVTSVPNGSVEAGSMVFIKKLTASSSATLSFVDGSDGVVLDDTYKEYYITFKDIHPSSDNAFFKFNLSTDNGSNYNVTKTTTNFFAQHSESNSISELYYEGANDLAQSTDFQTITHGIGNGNDECASGTLHLFNPSSTTFVKHFISKFNIYDDNNRSFNSFVAGYGNTTNSVDAIRFQMGSGNIDAGDICLYGIV